MKRRAHYDATALREVLRRADNVERVVRRLYGDEARSEGGQFLLAGLAGGAGDACRIDATGRDAGTFRDVSPAAPRVHGDLVDAVEAVRGCSTKEAIRWLGDLLGAPSALSVVDGGRDDADTEAPEVTPLSDETRRRLQARLAATPEALAYLERLGVDADTREHFRIGVDGGAGKPGSQRDGAPNGPVLAFPVLAQDGTPIKRLMKAAIPGATQQAPAGRWCAGAAQTTWCGPVDGKRWLAVVDAPQDQWALWQAIQGTSLAARLAIVTSSRPGLVPKDWGQPTFWARWDRVYFGQGNDAAGERAAIELRAGLRREVRRLEPPRKLSAGWVGLLGKNDPSILVGAARHGARARRAEAGGGNVAPARAAGRRRLQGRPHQRERGLPQRHDVLSLPRTAGGDHAPPPHPARRQRGHRRGAGDALRDAGGALQRRGARAARGAGAGPPAPKFDTSRGDL